MRDKSASSETSQSIHKTRGPGISMWNSKSNSETSDSAATHNVHTHMLRYKDPKHKLGLFPKPTIIATEGIHTV